jgi:hypothetical protein
LKSHPKWKDYKGLVTSNSTSPSSKGNQSPRPEGNKAAKLKRSMDQSFSSIAQEKKKQTRLIEKKVKCNISSLQLKILAEMENGPDKTALLKDLYNEVKQLKGKDIVDDDDGDVNQQSTGVSVEDETGDNIETEQ